MAKANGSVGVKLPCVLAHGRDETRSRTLISAMRWSVKIARVAGTEVRIHITFLLFLAWIGFSYYQVGGAAAAIPGVLFLLALFGCVLLHEFGHVLAARAFGIPTPDITLLPIGGVARLQRMPDKPWQELIVAIAGPLVNVGIAVVLILFLGHSASIENLEQVEHPRCRHAHEAGLGQCDVWSLFNLIPAFPMDGGRVLRALLAMALPYGAPPRSQLGSARHWHLSLVSFSFFTDSLAIRCSSSLPSSSFLAPSKRLRWPN